MTDLTARVTRLLPILYPGWDHMSPNAQWRAEQDTRRVLSALDTAGKLVPDNAVDITIWDGASHCQQCGRDLATDRRPSTLTDLIDAARNHTCDDDRSDELDAEGRRDDAR